MAKNHSADEDAGGEWVVRVEGVSFFRGGAEGEMRPILRDVSWGVKRGEIAAVLGANGSGKSTLLRIMAGYLWPQRGAVHLLGSRLAEVPLAGLRARLGIVEATTVYPFDEGITAVEVVLTGYFSALTLGYVDVAPGQIEHARHLLEQVGLSSKERQAYDTLSTGERMRCLLARALVRKPELLLLDEPTAGLDLPARETLLATLARVHGAGLSAGGAPAMVTITHHLEELLPGTSNVLLLSREGQVVSQGRPERVLTDEAMSAAYGVRIQVSARDGRFSAHVDPRTWDELI